MPPTSKALPSPRPWSDGPTVRLSAAIDGASAVWRRMALGLPEDGARPSLLVAYPYLRGFQRFRDRLFFRDWALDSGAYTAKNAGTEIENGEFLDVAEELLASDPSLVEVFALDVIGDWKASLKNAEAAWERGVPVIPCYHEGEPESVLLGLARDFPKIALGGAVGLNSKRKMVWAAECFARVWPKRIHGFGFGSRAHVVSLPWHSTDATNWALGPLKFGVWQAYGGQSVSIRGQAAQNLRVEVDHYVATEREARRRWAKEMATLAALPPTREGH